MTETTTSAVTETYRLALQQSITRVISNDEDWTRFLAISSEAARRVDAETEAFKTDYQSRLSGARNVILREYAGRSFDMPMPGGMAKSKELPSPAKPDQMADARVGVDHAARLQAIRQDEVDQLRDMRRDLVARSHAERAAAQTRSAEHRAGHAQDAFQTAQMRSPETRKR